MFLITFYKPELLPKDGYKTSETSLIKTGFAVKFVYLPFPYFLQIFTNRYSENL